MILRRTIYVLFFVASLLLAACETDDGEAECLPRRTVLFYLGCDNSLSGEVAQTLEQLRVGCKGIKGNLLVYVDNRESNPQLLECRTESGEVRMKVVREYTESNSADAEVFASVIHEVTTLYPAPSYGLIVLSHASGWLPEHTFENAALRSIIIDGSDKNEMELADFAAAIPDRLFNYIIFDACFMAGIEVAWELKDKTETIVASSAEVLSPGFTAVYPTALAGLFEPKANLNAFASAVYRYFGNQQGDHRSFTGSIIQTANLLPLAAFLKENAAIDRLQEVAITDIQGFDRNRNSLFFDFADTYSHLVPEEKQAEFSRLVNECVVWKAATENFMPGYGGFEVKKHSGLTTYIPQERYPNLNEAYKRLKWYKEVLIGMENRK